jgi:hypothetical protein
MDEIVEEPSHGYPGRHLRLRGPFASEVLDLNSGHRIIYGYGPITIRFRLIEPPR